MERSILNYWNPPCGGHRFRAGTFAVPLGDGPERTGLKEYAKSAFDVDMSETEANRFYDEFFCEYQGLATWHARAKADANDENVFEVRTLAVGRRQFIGDKWWNRFTALLNTPDSGFLR